MKMFTAIVGSLALAATAASQGPRPGITQDWGKVEQRIAWFGTWEAATAAAAATDRPILLVFAAPHCSQVPGMW